MNKAHLTLMSVEALEKQLEHLSLISATERAWSTIGETDSGKKLLQALHDERESTRDLYRLIVPHDASAMTMLAGLQGEERKLDSMIGRLASKKIFDKTIDEEMRFVQSLISQKKSTKREEQ